LLHAPTYEKLCAALTAFMDLAVDCGFLCHPGKLEPPNQVVKYTGFLVDTREAPALSLTIAKKDKALAMASKLLDMTEPLSALTLSVVVGTLESVVEGTPRRRGRGYLRELYAVLHGTTFADEEKGLAQLENLAEDTRIDGESTTLDEVAASQGTTLDGRQKYFRDVILTDSCRVELQWWIDTLSSKTCCQTVNSARGHVFTPTWGDGSGTGTGGTVDAPVLDLTQWQGSWLPASAWRTSNWKELKTLRLTLELIERDPSLTQAVQGTTVFYFTDNVVTYYIGHSGASGHKSLHVLIMAIKELERKLQVQLEVVHVPGTVMIVQGTDGLSRGIWIGEDHTSQPTAQLTQSVFNPVALHWALPSWVQQKCGSLGSPGLRDWQGEWSAGLVLDQFSLWAPPPTIAQQLLYFLLTTWVERPLTTSFAVLVPRVMQREWQNLSRYVQRVGEYAANTVPCGQQETALPIPIVLLYVAPHQRSLKSRRPKKFAVSTSSKRHREQADKMRGLPASIS
jgi:hypothetical protein